MPYTPIRSRTGAPLAAFVVVLVGVADARRTDAGETYCLSSVRPAVNAEFPYGERGDRCEGAYAEPTHGGSLHLVSLTTAAGQSGSTTAPTVAVSWRSAAAQLPVQLTAVSLRWRAYYRMDTRQPPNVHRFQWATDYMRALRLAEDDIGFLAVTSRPLGGKRRGPSIFPSAWRPANRRRLGRAIGS
jgi:hypothetical protein